MNSQQKITFGDVRAAGMRNVLIYCSNYRCEHFNIVPDDADRWPDELRISDIEDKFVCIGCGKHGADIRPDWESARQTFSLQNLVRPRHHLDAELNTSAFGRWAELLSSI